MVYTSFIIGKCSHTALFPPKPYAAEIVRLSAMLLLALFGFLKTDITAAQTPSAPILHCVNLLPDGSIELQWQPGSGSPVTVCAGTGSGATFTDYDIYVSTDGTTYSLLASITDPAQTTYIDNISSASGTLYYYLTTTCGPVTSPASVIIDSAPPVPPVISHVTVQADNIVSLTWTPGTSPETYGYIIYRADANGNFLPIDTIYLSDLPAGLSQTYIDQNAAPALRAETYKIAAFDSCYLLPGPDNGIPHKTIFLTAEGNECDHAIELDWSKYEGWGDGVKNYIVGVSDNNGTVVEAGSFSGNVTHFSYELPEGVDQACLIIQAVRNDDVTTSNSNRVCMILNPTGGPDYMYITNATVQDNNTVTLTWSIDVSDVLTDLRVRRSANDILNFSNIAEYDFGSEPTAEMSYTDTGGSLDITTNSYAYQIQHTNECDQKTFSTIVKIMSLTGRDNFDQSNGLTWTPFYLEYATITGYTIYRADSLSGTFSPIGTVAGDVTEYDDALDPLANDSNPLHCYYIVATYDLQTPDLPLMSNLESHSNIVCVRQSPRIFVPNAFMPNGVNNIFKPVLTYPNQSAYSMLIFNRWGEVLFQTTDPDDGWNGQIKNQLAPQDTYLYVIKMTTSGGYEIERKGTVTLIR